MILKGYKAKSNQKFINKLLDARNTVLSPKKIESVGILFSVKEFDDFDAFRNVFKNLNVDVNKIKIFGYVDDLKQLERYKEQFFTIKQIGWKGHIKNDLLKNFLNTEFDALISYYKQDNLSLNLATASSKANFKIGLSNADQRLNDLIIDVDPKEFELFQQELKKYLTKLNKI